MTPHPPLRELSQAEPAVNHTNGAQQWPIVIASQAPGWRACQKTLSDALTVFWKNGA